jgi:hypothetical protein
VLKAATVALLEMPSQFSRATDLNGPHDLSVRGGQAMGLTVTLPVVAKNVGQFGALFVNSCFPPLIERQHEKEPPSVRSEIAAGPKDWPWW